MSNSGAVVFLSVVYVFFLTGLAGSIAQSLWDFRHSMTFKKKTKF